MVIKSIIVFAKNIISKLGKSSIIFCSSYLQSNPLNGFSVGVGPSIGIGGAAAFQNVESYPSGGTVVLTTPYGFKLGPFDYTVSLAFGGYTGQYDRLSGSLRISGESVGSVG